MRRYTHSGPYDGGVWGDEKGEYVKIDELQERLLPLKHYLSDLGEAMLYKLLQELR